MVRDCKLQTASAEQTSCRQGKELLAKMRKQNVTGERLLHHFQFFTRLYIQCSARFYIQASHFHIGVYIHSTTFNSNIGIFIGHSAARPVIRVFPVVISPSHPFKAKLHQVSITVLTIHPAAVLAAIIRRRKQFKCNYRGICSGKIYTVGNVLKTTAAVLLPLVKSATDICLQVCITGTVTGTV